MNPQPDTNWYTDRSRYLDGFHCPRYRYLRYHAITGYGIDAKQISVPLTTGTYVHAPLAAIMEACKQGTRSPSMPSQSVSVSSLPSTSSIREIIRVGLIAYRDDLKDRGFLDVESSDVQRTMAEQACLIEGLLWGYVRAILPTILKEFEVVSIEREYLLPLADGIVFQARPDFVARRRSDGVLTLHD